MHKKSEIERKYYHSNLRDLFSNFDASILNKV